MSYLVDRERDTEAADRVQTWIAEQTVAGLHPTEVTKRRVEDAAGDEAWFFVIRLPDPEPDAGTWSADALNEFVRAVRDRALEEHLSSPWYVDVLPESEEDQEDEDEFQPGSDA
jgi:hypothetical protein